LGIRPTCSRVFLLCSRCCGGLSLFAHVLLALCIYVILFFCLREDPRVPATASPGTLKALSIDPDTYAFRAQRFNTYVVSERFRSGPGELGRGVDAHISNEEMDRINAVDGYNSHACKLVALDRSLGHRPAKECLAITYPDKLPTASVILIFFNEPFRLIIRTVFSIVNRSPPALLKEVLLLDDGSTQNDLLHNLDTFVKNTWPDGIVRIVRLPQRTGLIRARIEGAKAATADVIVILDAHCEVTYRWLEPLLYRIWQKPDAVVCPAIANIDRFTLKVFRTDVRYTEDGWLSLRVGSFAWDGMFVFEHPPRSSVVKRKSNADTIESLTMPGGLFAMCRDYFFKLGGYDDGMEIWGGENLELSFRIWQCGGSLEFSPCSTVGHVYRAIHPYSFPSNKDYNGHNIARMAEVWMDMYKENFHLARGDIKNMDYGNVSERKKLRTDLGCRSFQWFLDNIAPHKFVYSRNRLGYGSCCNAENHCLLRGNDGNEYRKQQMSLLVTSSQVTVHMWENLFALTDTGLLRKDWNCVRLRRSGGPIVSLWVFTELITDLELCPPEELEAPLEREWWRDWIAEQMKRIEHLQAKDPEQGFQAVTTTSQRNAHFRWILDKVHGKLINAQTGYCLDVIDGQRPVPRPCVDGAPSQSWHFSHHG
uniref:Polypeptide N-acetylgalactosaminyltransferase n=1 Tax=Hydatigena taeniaeformis TaxID=6205 RepID=A0A158RDH8_HYDTA